jgi:hypothetical protein
VASHHDGGDLRGTHGALIAALVHIATLDGNLHFTVRGEDGEVLDSVTVAELIERIERFK